MPLTAKARDPVLLQQDRIVAAATRDMEALIHAVSHELCVPVRHIDGFVAMFRNRAADRLDPEGRQCLDKISAACANMARMVDDLLVYARNTSGELKKTPVVLTPMVREVMDELAHVLLNRPTPGERAAGLFVWQLIAYGLFASAQKDLDYNAISYAVMDRHDYHDKSCNVNVDSIEVFFDATDPMLVAFIDELLAFEIRQETEGEAFVGYISLRFTAQTRALIGMERWPLTCAIEIAGLKDVTGVTELIDFAIALSRDRNFSGILHWGQRNESNVADIKHRFGDGADGGGLVALRAGLSRIPEGGRLNGFSSAVTRSQGV